MLLAVMMGLEQPSRLVLSKRRWIRRLLLASFCRMIFFTRNPSLCLIVEKTDMQLDTGKDEGFRVFSEILSGGCRDIRLLKG